MSIFRKFNSWFTKRIRNIDDVYLVDSMFIYFLLDIFSWSFSFDEEKMMDFLHFLRKENTKSYGPSISQVQSYTEREFDLILGAYEAKCLLQYVRLVGGDQCLLLPYPEETPQRTWCSQLDRLALKELHKAQHKKKQPIKKRDLKEYRALVRKQRVSSTCNVRILNKKKPEETEPPPLEHGTDHVYDFSSAMVKTSESDNNDDLMQKTQSVIDSIKRLNYLSDTGSEFSMGSMGSLGSRQSSCSRLDLDNESISLADSGGMFGDYEYGGDYFNDQNNDVVQELQRTDVTVATFTSTAPMSTPPSI